MPELPEVETIATDLNKKIKGDKIVDFESFWKKSIKGITFDEFVSGIVGREIVRARRIGKNLFIDLSGGKTIFIHLKMTGHLLVKSKVKSPKSKAEERYFDERVNQYIRHIFYLKTQDASCKIQINSKLQSPNSKQYDKTLEFSDLRKFGKLVLVDTDKLSELSEIAKLGTDVMSGDFHLKLFEGLLKKRKRSIIGNALMDQTLLSGIGNIYRSEILFEAGVDPKRRVGDLSESEIERIHKSILKVMKKAVKYRGTSDSDYRDTSGAPGEMHKHLKVYRREDEKCKKCDTIVRREKMGQRSVFFCTLCQS